VVQYIIVIYSDSTAILEQSHTYDPKHQTMQILQYRDKGTHLITIERFFIYAEFCKNNHLNDEHTVSPNKILKPC